MAEPQTLDEAVEGFRRTLRTTAEQIVANKRITGPEKFRAQCVAWVRAADAKDKAIADRDEALVSEERDLYRRHFAAPGFRPSVDERREFREARVEARDAVTPADLMQVMRRAITTGDDIVARACVAVASEMGYRDTSPLGYGPVVDLYTTAFPAERAGVERWWAVAREQARLVAEGDKLKTKVVRDAHLDIPKPPALDGMDDDQIRRIAATPVPEPTMDGAA